VYALRVVRTIYTNINDSSPPLRYIGGNDTDSNPHERCFSWCITNHCLFVDQPVNTGEEEEEEEEKEEEKEEGC
jgi:hypothetical protein